VVVALAVPSALYIALAGTDPASLPFFVHGFTLATNFAAVPWAAAMLLAAAAPLAAHSVPGTGWLERLGVASFEIFLVQVVWLGVLPERGPIPFLAAVVGSGVLGWALHRLLTAPAARLAGAVQRGRGLLARNRHLVNCPAADGRASSVVALPANVAATGTLSNGSGIADRDHSAPYAESRSWNARRRPSSASPRSPRTSCSRRWS
jgi:hypothetical protein